MPATSDSVKGSRDETIAVVYGVDNRFARPLAASIASALAHLGPGHDLDIYVIDGGLSRTNRARLTRSFEGGRCRLLWLRPTGRQLVGLKAGGPVTVATYYRLLIPELLPLSLGKAIYLDADLIVRADLGDLWRLPIGDRHLLAVQDMGVYFVSGRYGLANYRSLGIPAESKYFNAGVLVLNLNKWREEKSTQRLLDYLRTHAEDIRFWDQDALNALLWNSWGELDPRWNQMPQILKAGAAIESPFEVRTLRDVIENPFIIHYASDDKPWRYGCRHPAAGDFYTYLDRTAYRGFRPTRLRTRLGDSVHSLRKRLDRILARARIWWAGCLP